MIYLGIIAAPIASTITVNVVVINAALHTTTIIIFVAAMMVAFIAAIME